MIIFHTREGLHLYVEGRKRYKPWRYWFRRTIKGKNGQDGRPIYAMKRDLLYIDEFNDTEWGEVLAKQEAHRKGHEEARKKAEEEKAKKDAEAVIEADKAAVAKASAFISPRGKRR